MENMGNDSLLVKSRKLESGGHPIFDWNEFILGDQGILTSDFFENEIAAKVKQEIANGRFLILNEDSINAYAYTEDGSNVVAITKRSLYCCLYMANLFMLKDDFFPDIGNPDACYPKVSPSLFPITVDRDGNTVFPVSGDDERRNIGYIITVLALKYMVYHEVGHHKLGHLKQDKELYGLEGGEANALRNDATSSDHHDDKKSLNDYQRMEMEADIYSVQRIIDEFGDISAETAPFFVVALGHMELASLLAVALVIVKECLAPENLSFEDMDENIYLPKYLRLVMNLSTMILDADSTLMNEFKEVLMMVPRTREIIESEIGVISMDDPSKLREGLTEYLKSIVVFSEQTYAEIFLGTINAMAFWEDFKAAKWWKRS